MTRYSFKTGQFFSLQQATYCVERVVGETLHVISVNSGVVSAYSLRELLAYFASDQLKFLSCDDLPVTAVEAAAERRVERGLADFPQEVQYNALRKWKFLNAICPDGRLGHSRRLIEELLGKAWREIDLKYRGDGPPSLATFYRWRTKWVWARFDVRSLIDKWELRGQRPTSLPNRLSELIDEGIEKVYLTPQRETLGETVDWIQAQIEIENRRLPPEHALPHVTRRQVRRALSSMDRYDILKRRYGERYAKEATRLYGKGPVCTDPLERVEVDHSPLDLLVVDESTGLLLGRPWITVMIDAYSRMVVGFHVSFRKPSVRSVLRCLKGAILPKTYVRERFPSVHGEWAAYGLINELVCDNGLEFHAQDLEAACAELGTHVIYCPTRAPQMKGRIERFLKTLNYGLIHVQPGTTFARYDKRHAYDSAAMAVLTLEALQEIIHRWIIDVYAVSFHRGINTTPKEKWDEGVKRSLLRLPPSTDVVNVYLGSTYTRKLTKSGVGLHSLQYTSTSLEDLRGRRGDIDLTVRADPDNIGAIFVFDEEAQQYIEAKSTNSEYAEGVTAEQHRWMLSKARKDYRSSPLHLALLMAKVELREETARLIADGGMAKRNTKRPKATRAEWEVMVQHEEMRQRAPSRDISSENEVTSTAEQFDETEETIEPLLFSVRRGSACRMDPKPPSTEVPAGLDASGSQQ